MKHKSEAHTLAFKAGSDTRVKHTLVPSKPKGRAPGSAGQAQACAVCGLWVRKDCLPGYVPFTAATVSITSDKHFIVALKVF